MEKSPFPRWGRVFGRAPAAEVDEELQFHIEECIRENIARGADPDEARKDALARFGEMDPVRRECTDLLNAERKDEARRSRLAASWLDFKLGLRMLRKYPGLTIIGGLGIAIGVAVSTGFLAFLNAYVSDDLPLEEGDRIVAIQMRVEPYGGWQNPTLDEFTELRNEVTSITEISAFRTAPYNLFTPDHPVESVGVAEISEAGLGVARVEPLFGRDLLEEDFEADASPVVVIGYSAWENYFAARRDIVGDQVRLGATRYTVVGVMPEGFAFPMNHNFWIPLRDNAFSAEATDNVDLREIDADATAFVFGRLAPGISMETAAAELATIETGASVGDPAAPQRRPRVMAYTYPLLDIQGYSGLVGSIGLLLFSLLLLGICLNVAILVYARTATRIAEITVRTALGASRWRIVAQLLVESFALSSVAAVVGLFITRMGLRIYLDHSEGVPFWVNRNLSGVEIAFTIGLAIVAAFAVGLIPGLQATGARLQSRLRQMGGGTGLQLGRVWTLLIVAQVAVAICILSGAAAMTLGAGGDALTRPTYRAERFLVLDLSSLAFPEEDGPRGEPLANPGPTGLQNEVLRRLEMQAGVSDVTFADQMPSNYGLQRRVNIEVGPGVLPITQMAGFQSVGVDFFDVMEVPLLAGRDFTPGDVSTTATAVIVNQAFARQLLGGSNPLGRRFRYDLDPETSYEIVGVVGDLYKTLFDGLRVLPMVFHPTELGSDRMSLVARVQGTSPANLIPQIRDIVSTIDPTAVAQVDGLDAILRRRGQGAALFALALCGAFLSIVLLSAGGVYALMSFSVTRRQREAGIRAAIGASRQQIIRAIFSRAVWQLLAGLTFGVVASLLIDRLSGGEFLTGRGAFLLPTFAILMLIGGLIAVIGPARRALRIHPSEALRAD